MSQPLKPMRYKHIPNVIAKAEFETEGSALYRYRLEIIRVGAGESPKTACVVMQNPSYAGEEYADKSVQFMEKVVFERALPEFNGIERLIVVNLFARVQTTGFVGYPSNVGSRNNKAIENAFRESNIIVIGWGTSNRFEHRKSFVLALLAHMTGKKVYRTRMHPSRGRYDGFIQPFDI